MLCLCAAQVKVWFQTDLARENSASYYRQGRQLVAFDFSFLTLVMRWSRSTSNFCKFDRWVHVENLCSILKLFYFESWSWQSFVSTCDVLYCLFYWNYKMKFICYQESLLFMASLFIGFLVGKYVACQSRKSDFGWCRFCFWPCLMRKLSGAASQMVSLSD